MIWEPCDETMRCTHNDFDVQSALIDDSPALHGPTRVEQACWAFPEGSQLQASEVAACLRSKLPMPSGSGEISPQDKQWSAPVTHGAWFLHGFWDGSPQIA